MNFDVKIHPFLSKIYQQISFKKLKDGIIIYGYFGYEKIEIVS